jgi:hypothetical protein
MSNLSLLLGEERTSDFGQSGPLMTHFGHQQSRVGLAKRHFDLYRQGQSGSYDALLALGLI